MKMPASVLMRHAVQLDNARNLDTWGRERRTARTSQVANTADKHFLPTAEGTTESVSLSIPPQNHNSEGLC